jgi:hypothetical protein
LTGEAGLDGFGDELECAAFLLPAAETRGHPGNPGNPRETRGHPALWANPGKIPGDTENAGINRLGVGNERVLRRRSRRTTAASNRTHADRDVPGVASGERYRQASPPRGYPAPKSGIPCAEECGVCGKAIRLFALLAAQKWKGGHSGSAKSGMSPHQHAGQEMAGAVTGGAKWSSVSSRLRTPPASHQ